MVWEKLADACIKGTDLDSELESVQKHRGDENDIPDKPSLGWHRESGMDPTSLGNGNITPNDLNWKQRLGQMRGEGHLSVLNTSNLL